MMLKNTALVHLMRIWVGMAELMGEGGYRALL